MKGFDAVVSWEDEAVRMVDAPGPVPPRWRLLAGSCGVQLGEQWLRECGKPDCERLVPDSVRFCCAPCAVAAEGRYEIDRHQESCDVLWSEREQALTELFGDT